MHTLWTSIMFCISLLLIKHDFHASMTKIEYSAKNESLQCIMNIFKDDFELALSNFHHRTVKYKENNTDKDIIPYLNSIFSVKTKKGKVLSLQYVGSKHKINTVQLYFEILCDKNDLKYLSISHKLLFNEFADQVNIVNFYVSGEKKSLVFTASESTKIVGF